MDQKRRWIQVDAEVEIVPPEANPPHTVVIWFGARLLVDGRRFAGSFEHDTNDILDVSAFFRSLREPGRTALFTCTCGVFGCGGCWTDVVHTEEAWIVRNAYDPKSDDPDCAELLEEFELSAAWDDVWATAAKIDRELAHVRTRYPDQPIVNGTVGPLLNEVRLETVNGLERAGG